MSIKNCQNKPDWATTRPGCVSACIEHVTYMERQMDKQTDETTKVVKEALKTCLIQLVCFY